jgi:hypothetical protein
MNILKANGFGIWPNYKKPGFLSDLLLIREKKSGKNVRIPIQTLTHCGKGGILVTLSNGKQLDLVIE